MAVEDIRKHLKKLGDKKRAKELQRYFKTGKGEYGEGDRFLGIRVPELRKLAKMHRNITLDEIEALLQSPIHEERLLALLILTLVYTNAGDYLKKRVYQFYLQHREYVNNWDLVDLSAPNIVGDYLLERDRRRLYRLAKSKQLWDRRIAALSTFAFIKNKDFGDALQIAESLITDKEELIHKAVGWMLREIGKQDLKAEEAFLKEHYKRMPRTMLRYAIEKLPEKKREKYLKGKV